jgi:hypothetical protein
MGGIQPRHVVGLRAVTELVTMALVFAVLVALVVAATWGEWRK